MMPENTLSSSTIYGAFLVPDKVDPRIDYEWGGVDLLDTSQGLMVYIWKCFYEDGWIQITNDEITHKLIQVENVKHLSLAFDFNMHPTITYVVESINDEGEKVRETYLYWYDTAIADQTTTKYGIEYLFPQLSLDDHRLHQSANADIIFAYIRNRNLYYRQQRDRFLIERLLYSNLFDEDDSRELRQIGMSVKNRFQFMFW